MNAINSVILPEQAGTRLINCTVTEVDVVHLINIISPLHAGSLVAGIVAHLCCGIIGQQLHLAIHYVAEVWSEHIIQPPLGPLIQVYEDFFVGLLDLSNAASGVEIVRNNLNLGRKFGG